MKSRKSWLTQKSLLPLWIGSVWAILTSCASPSIEAKKTPGADLWMYHTYAWKYDGKPGESASLSQTEQQVRDHADRKLSDRGYIRVPPAGNPDFWIKDQVTSQNIEFEFIDGHTGHLFWKGRASNGNIESSVNQLIHHYIAAQNWMPASFWWKGIDIVGE
jgi:hypothetical protein